MATLQITAYALTHTKKERNTDNLYINGRFLCNAHDPQYKFEETHAGNIQVYAVSDAGARNKNCDISARNGELVMSTVQAMQDDMKGQNRVEKGTIWDYMSMANDKVISRAHQNGEEMGVSLSGLAFQGDRVVSFHVGDTRIYCIRDHAITQMTKDNLAIGELLERGVITREKMDTYKKSSQLSAYLGMDDLVDAKETIFDEHNGYFFQKNDMFLLCSDGIADTFSENEMEELVREMAGLSPRDILPLMAKRAAERNDDDFTMLFLTVDALGDASRTEEPTVRKKTFATQKEQKAATYESQDEVKPFTDETSSMGDTKPMEPIRAERYDNDFGDGLSLEEAAQQIEAETNSYPSQTDTSNESKNQFDPKAFSASLEKYQDDLKTDSDKDDNEEVEESALPARKIIVAVVAVACFLFAIGGICLAIRWISENNQDESSQPAPIVESQISEEESEPESIEESESEIESEVESEPESVVESEPESEPESEILTVYTVVEGNTWWGMCNKFYGSQYCKQEYYTAIQKYNNIEGKTLVAGMQITFPTLETLKKLAGDAE